MSSQIRDAFGTRTPEFTASQIAAVNVVKRKYQKEYMDYWNSTAKITKNGRPVDAVICAVAPYAAPVAGKYDYYGMFICAYILSFVWLRANLGWGS